MRVSLKFRDRVAAVSQAILEELEQLAAAINVGWSVEHNLDGTHKYATVAAAGSGVPPGFTGGYSGTTLPLGGWLWCDGAEYAPATYPALYAAIGTTWNTGGETPGYFRVPNGKKRMLIGADTGFAVGTVGGNFDHVHTGPSHDHTITHTHTGPSHSHAVTVDGESAHTHPFSDTTDGPSAVTRVATGSDVDVASDAHTHGVGGTTSAGTSHTHTASTAADGTGNTGASSAASTGAGGTGNTGAANPPHFVGNWIIKT